MITCESSPISSLVLNRQSAQGSNTGPCRWHAGTSATPVPSQCPWQPQASARNFPHNARMERQMGAYNSALQVPIEAQDGGVARPPSAQATNDPTAIRNLIAFQKWPLSQCHLQATKLQWAHPAMRGKPQLPRNVLQKWTMLPRHPLHL